MKSKGNGSVGLTIRVSGEFALSEFELSGSSRYSSLSYRGVRVIRVRVIREFALFDFDLSGFYCTITF